MVAIPPNSRARLANPPQTEMALIHFIGIETDSPVLDFNAKPIAVSGQSNPRLAAVAMSPYVRKALLNNAEDSGLQRWSQAADLNVLHELHLETELFVRLADR